MKNKRKYVLILLFTLCLVMALMIAIFYTSQKKETNKPAVFKINENQTHMIFGSGVKQNLINKPFAHLQINSSNGELLGYILSSEDLQIVNHGYKTEVKVFLAVDFLKQIKKVILYDLKESPKQVAMINKSAMIKKWQEKGAFDIPPDTVTGATRTSSAINKTVNEMLKRIN